MNKKNNEIKYEDKKNMSNEIMTRYVLRFYILYEYYKECLNLDGFWGTRATKSIDDLTRPENEKKFAKWYLAEAKFVTGTITLDGTCHIMRITTKGVDFVEHVIGKTDFGSVQIQMTDNVAKHRFMTDITSKITGRIDSKTIKLLTALGKTMAELTSKPWADYGHL